MRALVYHGPKNVSGDEVPDATVERPTDALVRITTTNICGSDLHMYEGRTGVEEGKVLGHENRARSSGSVTASITSRSATWSSAVQHRLRLLQEV